MVPSTQCTEGNAHNAETNFPGDCTRWVKVAGPGTRKRKTIWDFLTKPTKGYLTVFLVDDPIKCNIWWPLPPLYHFLVKLLRTPSGSLIQNYSQSQPPELLSFLRTLFNPKKCQFIGIFIFDWAAIFEFYDFTCKISK